MEKRSGMAFLDLEAAVESRRIRDIGAVRWDGAVYHGASIAELRAFLRGADTLCGHNLLHHDLELLRGETGENWGGRVVDTLYLSPLFFPKHPYHALLKDDKLQAEELNNPVNDCLKAKKLYEDEVSACSELTPLVRSVYAALLRRIPEFQGFWEIWEEKENAEFSAREGGEAAGMDAVASPAGAKEREKDPVFTEAGGVEERSSDPGMEKPGEDRLAEAIREGWKGLFCENASLPALIQRRPVELAYALAVIGARDDLSVTPGWVLRNYPGTAQVLHLLRATPCREGCPYCEGRLDLKKGLRRIFGYTEFRTYGGRPLQEEAARAAMAGESLLAVFPTGGGKSLTFQLPALLQGEAMHGLTVVLSPLQSLQKDQGDHLMGAGITGAVMINSSMSAIERAEAIERVMNGSATLLMIAPEQLRSRTVERMLESRTIVRFVIDEAHCFSAWGQDFRVDYLYIGDFIRQLQEKRSDRRPIPVSCFTATARKRVIRDIQEYFARKLQIHLTLYATGMERENLSYHVLLRNTDQEKYQALRQLVTEKDCPTIVYVSRTRRARELADRLCADGFEARPFHGKMFPSEKTENQDAFLQNRVRIMVATSAFGMGVDKRDVGMVVHYDISDSLENYVQEAGRAGRDPQTRAECWVLYTQSDLDRHFMLLNQTRLSMGEIQQVWRAMKEMTRGRDTVTCSALELARQAGWDTNGSEMETRVKTAVTALEQSGYVRRGHNMPRIYASGIRAANMSEAAARVRASALMSPEQQRNALRILQFLISRRSIARAGNDEAESRVDYIADLLGLEKRDVIETIHLLRQEGLLADTQDMSAWLWKTDSINRSEQILNHFGRLEAFLLDQTAGRSGPFELKKLNEEAESRGMTWSSIRNLRTILYFWSVKGYAQKQENRERGLALLEWNLDETAMLAKMTRRMDLCAFALRRLFDKAGKPAAEADQMIPVNFSLVGLFEEYAAAPRQQQMQLDGQGVSLRDLEDALLYLSRIGAMKLEGGFLVLYNGMELKRLEKDNRARYKREDYQLLNEFYHQKVQQIHIVGEYASLVEKDPVKARKLARDYFQMEDREFVKTWFPGEREREINRNITPGKHAQLFGELSPRQAEIIGDASSRAIVVAAGPGSGKTRVLAHKLASLLLMEDVKHEQLLMLTFTRAAATEFKKRLHALIGNAAHFVEIKTFHSYCFDLLGRVGSLEQAAEAVPTAVRMIENGGIEPDRIRKAVLVIDEAQDMDDHEYALVQALMRQNENMRVIAVGDDDQNIYGFRGSSARHLRDLQQSHGAKLYEMTENYRSLGAVVDLENAWAATLRDRMKTQPLAAVRPEMGKVVLTRHGGQRFFRAVTDQIADTWKGGSAAVLTSTNEEALQLFTLLKRRGIPTKLVQGMDGFSLGNLLELRVFLSALDSRLRGRAVIPPEIWEQAKAHTEKVCAGSAALELCRNLWRDFEAVSLTRYRSDLEGFLRESREEDFVQAEKGRVAVSTVHRAKGREFDQVWLLLRETNPRTEEEKRRIYVGMTRARDELYLHAPRSAGEFGFELPPQVEIVENPAVEPELEEILLQLGHRDVVLNFFRSRESLLGRCRAGQILGMEGDYLTVEQEGKTIRVAKLSQACLARMEALQQKGYRFAGGWIRRIVAWQAEEDPAECWVLLPNMRLTRAEKAREQE